MLVPREAPWREGRNRLHQREHHRRLPAVRHTLTIFLLLIFAAFSRADWTIITYDGRRHVPLQDVASFYRMNLLAAGGDGFRLVAPGRTISGRAGGRDIIMNGVKHVLCFPIAKQNGRTLISAMDVTKIIEPVMRPQKIKNATPVRTVILDAGHGGHDSGAVGPFGREKDAALDVVLRAKRLLQAAGYKVLLTRSTDVFIPLEERSAFANRYSNAIFISVHFNKSKSSGGTGVETYCLAPRGVPSMDEENLSYSDFKLQPGHARDPENVALATAVHWSLLRDSPLTDRGIKRARFHVIRAIKIPGILIEGGFMSSPTDARLIAGPLYRQRIAQAILNGVNRYRQAVGAPPPSQVPSAVVAASGPSTVPDLRRYSVPASRTPAATGKGMATQE